MIPAGTPVVPLELAKQCMVGSIWSSDIDLAEHAVPMPAVSALDTLATWAASERWRAFTVRAPGKDGSEWEIEAFVWNTDASIDWETGPSASEAARRLHTTLNERSQT